MQITCQNVQNILKAAVSFHYEISVYGQDKIAEPCEHIQLIGDIKYQRYWGQNDLISHNRNNRAIGELSVS